MELSTVALLIGDSLALKLLDAFKKKKTIRFKDVISSVETHEPSDDALYEKLDKLKEAKLIQEGPGTVQEFRTYYLTSDGLAAIRQLDRLNRGSKSGKSKRALGL